LGHPKIGIFVGHCYFLFSHFYFYFVWYVGPKKSGNPDYNLSASVDLSVCSLKFLRYNLLSDILDVISIHQLPGGVLNEQVDSWYLEIISRFPSMPLIAKTNHRHFFKFSISLRQRLNSGGH
jgi:hypothetical protein